MKHGHRGFYLEQRFLIYFSVHAGLKKIVCLPLTLFSNISIYNVTLVRPTIKKPQVEMIFSLHRHGN